MVGIRPRQFTENLSLWCASIQCQLGILFHPRHIIMLSLSNVPSIRVGLKSLKVLIRSDVYQFLHVLVTKVYQVLHAVQQEVEKAIIRKSCS